MTTKQERPPVLVHPHDFRPGDRVRWIGDPCCGGEVVRLTGMTGVVVGEEEDTPPWRRLYLMVRLDEPVPELAGWGNCAAIVFRGGSPDELPSDPALYLERLA